MKEPKKKGKIVMPNNNRESKSVKGKPKPTVNPELLELVTKENVERIIEAERGKKRPAYKARAFKNARLWMIGLDEVDRPILLVDRHKHRKKPHPKSMNRLARRPVRKDGINDFAKMLHAAKMRTGYNSYEIARRLGRSWKYIKTLTTPNTRVCNAANIQIFLDLGDLANIPRHYAFVIAVRELIPKEFVKYKPYLGTTSPPRRNKSTLVEYYGHDIVDDIIKGLPVDRRELNFEDT